MRLTARRIPARRPCFLITILRVFRQSVSALETCAGVIVVLRCHLRRVRDDGPLPARFAARPDHDPLLPADVARLARGGAALSAGKPARELPDDLRTGLAPPPDRLLGVRTPRRVRAPSRRARPDASNRGRTAGLRGRPLHERHHAVHAGTRRRRVARRRRENSHDPRVRDGTRPPHARDLLPAGPVTGVLRARGAHLAARRARRLAADGDGAPSPTSRRRVRRIARPAAARVGALVGGAPREPRLVPGARLLPFTARQPVVGRRDDRGARRLRIRDGVGAPGAARTGAPDVRDRAARAHGHVPGLRSEAEASPGGPSSRSGAPPSAGVVRGRRGPGRGRFRDRAPPDRASRDVRAGGVRAVPNAAHAPPRMVPARAAFTTTGCRRCSLVAEVPEDSLVEDRSLELEGPALRRLIDAAAERILAHVASLPDQPSADVEGGAELARSLAEPMPETGTDAEELLDLLFDRVIPKSFNTAGPGYLAYIPGGGLPHSAVADLVSDATNRYVGVFAAAPGVAQLEANVCRWFCTLAGLPPSSRGILTSGGSLATFSAVVAARRDRLPGGLPPRPHLRVRPVAPRGSQGRAARGLPGVVGARDRERRSLPHPRRRARAGDRRGPRRRARRRSSSSETPAPRIRARSTTCRAWPTSPRASASGSTSTRRTAGSSS